MKNKSGRELEYNEEYKMVVSNKYIKAVHPDKFSITAMKLFRLVITQCKWKDKKFYEYSFKIKDLANTLNIDSSNIYRDIQNMCITMMQMLLLTGTDNPKEKWEIKHIFEKCQYNPETGIVNIQLHDNMTDLFLYLKGNYTEIPIVSILLLKSKHAIRLYELICSKMMHNFPYSNISTEIQISLNEIRDVTGTTKNKTYNSIGNLKNRILLPSLEEIEKAADWKIICSNIKQGRRIVGFDLIIWSVNGYEYIEKCKREGIIPTGDMPITVQGKQME